MNRAIETCLNFGKCACVINMMKKLLVFYQAFNFNSLKCLSLMELFNLLVKSWYNLNWYLRAYTEIHMRQPNSLSYCLPKIPSIKFNNYKLQLFGKLYSRFKHYNNMKLKWTSTVSPYWTCRKLHIFPVNITACAFNPFFPFDLKLVKIHIQNDTLYPRQNQKNMIL